MKRHLLDLARLAVVAPFAMIVAGASTVGQWIIESVVVEPSLGDEADDWLAGLVDGDHADDETCEDEDCRTCWINWEDAGESIGPEDRAIETYDGEEG